MSVVLVCLFQDARSAFPMLYLFERVSRSIAEPGVNKNDVRAVLIHKTEWLSEDETLTEYMLSRIK